MDERLSLQSSSEHMSHLLNVISRVACQRFINIALSLTYSFESFVAKSFHWLDGSRAKARNQAREDRAH